MTDKTGGTAFPIPATEWHGTDTGMTLRDYLAAKCMQGDWAQDGIDAIFKDRAETYYRMADAMLNAREK